MLPVIVPKLDLQTQEIEIIRWYRREGERVQAGDPLLEIATEKATVDIEAPESGLLQGIAFSAGERVKVGQTLAFIVGEGEQVPTKGEASISRASQSAADAVRIAPAPERISTVRSSPLARQLCRQHGVSIEEVFQAVGKEPVDEKTVQHYLALHPRALLVAAEEFEDIALSPRRKLIAQRMKESQQNIPAIYLFSEVVLDQLEKCKSELSASGLRVTLTDLLIPIIGKVLTELPQFNANLLDGDVEPIVRCYHSVNLGLAVDTDQGLVAPVIKDITHKPLLQIVREKDELIAKARANRLAPADIHGATFTLTNLGMFDVAAFIALINPPEVAILSVGTIRERIGLAGGKPEVLHIAEVCLGMDHRALDGADGGRFLSRFKAYVEDTSSAALLA